MTGVHKCIKLIFHIIFFVLVSYILNQKPTKPVKKIERFIVDMRHILLWTKFPSLEQEGQVIFIKENCRYINCYLTTNRTLLGDLRHFDALVFNAEEISIQDVDLPSVRSDVQKYIFAANDSSDNFPICNPIYDNYFNWTWTYRLDSSIPFTYLKVYNLHKEILGNNIEWMHITDMQPISQFFKSLLSTKSKAAVIFLDKCESNSKREHFLIILNKELNKFNLTIDVFGNCGLKKCGRRNMNPCFHKLKTRYYFYMALEDSIADDFITNVVLFGFNYNAVPIVYGGAKYNKFLPPNSYLDASQLSVEMLAKTMYDIIHNKDWYYDFFKWKNHYIVKEAKGMNVCALCNVFNNPTWLELSTSIVYFRKWWNSYYEQRCGFRYSYFAL